MDTSLVVFSNIIKAFKNENLGDNFGGFYKFAHLLALEFLDNNINDNFILHQFSPVINI